MIRETLRKDVPLNVYTTLRVGGPADWLVECDTAELLAEAYQFGLDQNMPVSVIGSGSNLLPADEGVEGLVIVNRASRISVARTGEVVAETGAWFQDVFLRSAQCGLEGLSFAVGIPGSIGGAMVSNAGAYRSSIGELVRAVEVADERGCRWEAPDWMEFGYRDSVFRGRGLRAAMTRVQLKLKPGDRRRIYNDAREFQRQRISKQPAGPSAGSFFKNVYDRKLATTLPGLTAGMRDSGVVPAGFLIEAVGLKGHRIGGAMLGVRHANFILNVNHASATEIRRLAMKAEEQVFATFGVHLEAEVLPVGRWAK